MAREVLVKLVDDIDGGEATTTVQLSLDGRSVELDLSDKNLAALNKALDKFLAAGRPVATTRTSQPRARASKKADRAYDLAQLREWAAGKGITVPQRGRIPQATVDQYLAEGGK